MTYNKTSLGSTKGCRTREPARRVDIGRSAPGRSTQPDTNSSNSTAVIRSTCILIFFGTMSTYKAFDLKHRRFYPSNFLRRPARALHMQSLHMPWTVFLLYFLRTQTQIHGYLLKHLRGHAMIRKWKTEKPIRYT